MSRRPREIEWRSPAGVGLLGALGGLFIAGPVGGVAGLVAGVVAARRTQAVLLAAGAALCLAAVFTLLEQPLNESGISGFPGDHPLANFAGAIAGVLLLAGLVGMLANRDHATARISTEAPGRAATQIAAPNIVALLAAALLGALALWLLGDRLWQGPAIALAIGALVLIAVLVFRARSRDRPALPDSRP